MTANDQGTIEHAGTSLILSYDHTTWWRDERTLFVADTHFGKSAAFRAGGVPVPEHTTARDLERLDAAIKRTGATRLVILGDFLHAREGRTDDVQHAIASWRAEHAGLAIILVRGNHDHSAGDPPRAWAIDCVDPMTRLGPFTLLHHPPERGHEADGTYALAGHLHPAVRLIDPGTRSGVRLPCFWHRPDTLVLPAFGSFTGTHVIHPSAGDGVHVCADGAIIDVTARLARTRPRQRAGRAPRD